MFGDELTSKTDCIERFKQAGVEAVEYTFRATHREMAEVAGLKNPNYLLEAGCHEGNLSQAFAKRWKDLAVPFGLDKDAEALERFRRRFGARRAKLHDLETTAPWDFAEGIFDLVIISFVIEHISVKAFCRLILEAKRLAPGFLFGVHTFRGVIDQFPEVEPGRRKIPAPGLPPMLVGSEEFYKTAIIAGGFVSFEKVGTIFFPNKRQLGVFAGTEAAAIYLAKR